MEELTVIGVDNGALVVVGENGARYRVPITEALHTALRQNRPAAPAAHRVAPREVQALIRSGLTAAQVAEQTGEPLDYIQRFEGPVIAEREYVVTAARTVPVSVGADGDGGGSFGAVIDSRLDELGATRVRWSSRKKDQHWVVTVDFLDGEVERSARWTFEPKKSTLVPADHEAQSLSQQGASASPLVPRLRAVPPEEAQSTRFDSGAFTPDFDDASGSSPTAAPQRPIARIAPVDDADTQEVTSGQTADLLDALRRRRGEREGAAFDEREASRAAHPSTGAIRIIDIPLDDPASAPRAGDESNAESVDGAGVVDEAPATPGPTKTAGRKGRAAMPSWDDIVFGARPDDDPA